MPNVLTTDSELPKFFLDFDYGDGRAEPLIDMTGVIQGLKSHNSKLSFLPDCVSERFLEDFQSCMLLTAKFLDALGYQGEIIDELHVVLVCVCMNDASLLVEARSGEMMSNRLETAYVQIMKALSEIQTA